jgi:hypothetical protein
MIPEGYEPKPELRRNVRLWRADDPLIEAMNAAIDQIIDKRTAYQIYAKYVWPTTCPSQLRMAPSGEERPLQGSKGRLGPRGPD